MLQGLLRGRTGRAYEEKIFKSALAPILGQIVEKSNGDANFWRGWVLHGSNGIDNNHGLV